MPRVPTMWNSVICEQDNLSAKMLNRAGIWHAATFMLKCKQANTRNAVKP